MYTDEKDPSGIDQHAPGAKLDNNKIQARLLKRFGLALLAVADLATGGARKYSANGWAKVEKGEERYEDAALRHVLKDMFELKDPDMNQPHAVSEAWNALAKLQLMIEENKHWKARLMAGISKETRYDNEARPNNNDM